MSTIESVIGKARVTVNTVVCRHIFCAQCKSVMDQERAIVAELMHGTACLLRMYSCGNVNEDGSRCEPDRDHLQGTLDALTPARPGMQITISTWAGVEHITPSNNTVKD
jgi:hypothetical protein